MRASSTTSREIAELLNAAYADGEMGLVPARLRVWGREVVYGVADMAAIATPALILTWVLDGFPQCETEWRTTLTVLSLALLAVILLWLSGMHKLRGIHSFSMETLAVAKALLGSIIGLYAGLYVFGLTGVDVTRVCEAGLVGFAGCILWRRWRRGQAARAVADGRRCRNILLVGDSPDCSDLRDLLEQKTNIGCRLSAVWGPVNHAPQSANAELSNLILGQFIDEVLLVPPIGRELAVEILNLCRHYGVRLALVTSIEQTTDGIETDRVGPYPLIELCASRCGMGEICMKRCFDVVGSGLLLLAISPLLLVLAMLVKLDSSGPCIYSSKRVGKKGKCFNFYKFRSMVANADTIKKQLASQNERDGILFKMANDPRITRIGRILRRYSLDELPQLWNVFKGDMSLVGPRPPLPEEYAQYEIWHRKRLSVTPGITGLWQIEGRNDSSFENYIRYDFEYIDNWSFWLDCKLLLRTVVVVLNGSGE